MNRTILGILVVTLVVVGGSIWLMTPNTEQNNTTDYPSLIENISPILAHHPSVPTSETGWEFSNCNHGHNRETDVTDISRFYLGNCAIIHDDLEQAAAYFEAAIPPDPTQAPYLSATINLAWVYLQLGQSERSFDLIQKAITLFESQEDAILISILLEKRAQLHALSFDYDAAIADMDNAIILNPDDAARYNLRGQFIMLLYEWDRALEDYNTAIALDPTFANAYFNRGVLFYTQAAREEALADFERYLALAPEGLHAEEAQPYVESIQIELESLGN